MSSLDISLAVVLAYKAFIMPLPHVSKKLVRPKESLMAELPLIQRAVIPLSQSDSPRKADEALPMI